MTAFELPEPFAFALYDFEGGYDLYRVVCNEQLYQQNKASDPTTVIELYTKHTLLEAVRTAVLHAMHSGARVSRAAEQFE